jgi:hypothetical protein
MIGEWSKYAGDPEDSVVPVLPAKPTPDDVAKITQRMYDKKEYRRKLGMMARNIVQKSFSGDRYLREHEQMLWIGKARKEMLGLAEDPSLPTARPATTREVVDVLKEKMAHPRLPWLRPLSNRSSFTSTNDDPSSSSARQPPPASNRTSASTVNIKSSPVSSLGFSVKPQQPKPARLSGTLQRESPPRKTDKSKPPLAWASFASKMEAMDTRDGRTSRASSGSAYVPSHLSEVHTLEE